MSWSEHIPSVLAGVGNQSGISTERALKQARVLLELLDEVSYILDADTGNTDGRLQDRIQASLDDLAYMIERIER